MEEPNVKKIANSDYVGIAISGLEQAGPDETYEDVSSYTDYMTEVLGRFPHFNLSLAYAVSFGNGGTPNYNASAILVYFRRLQKFATMQRDGKTWFYCPMMRHACPKASGEGYRPISDRISWLSEGAIYGNVQVLVKAGLILKDEFNKAVYDRTCWYHVPDEVCKALDAETYRPYFFPDEAKRFGIHGALVMSSLYFDFDWYRCTENFTGYVKVNKAAIARRLGMRECTVRAVIKNLQAERCLHQHELGYRLLAPNRVTFNGVQTFQRRQLVRPTDAPMGQAVATDEQEAGAMVILRNAKAPAVKSAFMEAVPPNLTAGVTYVKLKKPTRRVRLRDQNFKRGMGYMNTPLADVIAKCKDEAALLA